MRPRTVSLPPRGLLARHPLISFLLNLSIVGVLALLVAVSCGSGDQSATADTDESATADGSEDVENLPPIHAGGGGGIRRPSSCGSWRRRSR